MPYIPYTDEQKQLANSINLPEFLRLRGENIEKIGRESKLIYTDSTGTHDSITMSGSIWYDHKNQIGGGPIKFMQTHYGMSFQEAMESLLGYSVEPLFHVPTKTAEEKRPFHLPEANGDMHRVYAYLMKQRFIAPEIITHFAKAHTLYEDKAHHNAVFVGVDENGTPKQAHKRSTNSFGKSFRMTVEGSDTRYSFAHFGDSEKLYVFEAPIDMLSFLTLFPADWEKYSYIAMNGVYESAVLHALETNPNLLQIILCTDHDIGGIEAAYRLKDILQAHGYNDVIRMLPEQKDWNEVLKAKNGADALPAVSHPQLEAYLSQANVLEQYHCNPEKLPSQIYATFKNEQYQSLTEYALAGSAFFLSKVRQDACWAWCRQQMVSGYRPHSDKGGKVLKLSALEEQIQVCMKDLKKTIWIDRDYELAGHNLLCLADRAMRVKVEEVLEQESEEIEDVMGVRIELS